MVVCMDAKQSDNRFKHRYKLVSNGKGEGETVVGADTGKVAMSTLRDGVVISITTKDSVDVDSVTGADSIIYIDRDNSIYIYFSQQ